MGGLNTFLVVALGALYGTSDSLANVALTGLLLMNALGVLVGGILASRTARHAAVAGLAWHSLESPPRSSASSVFPPLRLC